MQKHLNFIKNLIANNNGCFYLCFIVPMIFSSCNVPTYKNESAFNCCKLNISEKNNFGSVYSYTLGEKVLFLNWDPEIENFDSLYLDKYSMLHNSSDTICKGRDFSINFSDFRELGNSGKEFQVIEEFIVCNSNFAGYNIEFRSPLEFASSMMDSIRFYLEKNEVDLGEGVGNGIYEFNKGNQLRKVIIDTRKVVSKKDRMKTLSLNIELETS